MWLIEAFIDPEQETEKEMVGETEDATEKKHRHYMGNDMAKRKNTEAIEKLELKFISKQGGWHLLVFVKDEKFNFWPGTGEWSEYGDFKARKTGFFDHVKKLLAPPK